MDDRNETIQYFVHEGMIEKYDRLVSRLTHIIIGMIIGFVFVLSVVIYGFLWYISLPTDYEYAETITQETQDTGVNVIGGDYNGTTDENKAGQS